MAESTTALLRVRDLQVEFGIHGTTIHPVRGISFDIEEGETVALVGESGSGKSVTAQAILGILPKIARITHGQIQLRDVQDHRQTTDIARLAPDSQAMRAIRGARISMIFQEPMVSLSPVHTVGDQVSEALFLHRAMDKQQGMDVTETMLRMVGFPNPRQALRTYPFELSGGLRQRAMIAMALICHPSLLIADEPTTALDVTIQAQILKLIIDLQAELNMAVLIITHDLGVVANIAEKVLVMYHGQLMESGPIESIFRNPRHPYLQSLLKAVPHFDMKPGERLQPIREIDHELGHLLTDKKPWPDTQMHKPIIDVRHLTRRFSIRKSEFFGLGQADEILAVDNVSFEVYPRECFGLVGESGCGKTTLSKILMRAINANQGTFIYNDRGDELDVFNLGPEAIMDFRCKVQFIFQDPFSSLSPRMTVFDILREPMVIHKVGTAEEQREMASELMRMVGLDPRFLSRYPHSFSGGQRQRIGIARALALKPDVIICDEPVSALDVSIQAQILNLLKDLQAELGLTYLFISHNLAVVDYIADRIAVMCAGRLVEIAPKELLFNNPVHPYTQALLNAVPFADLSHKLNFESIAAGRQSQPSEWPRPFTINGDGATELIQIEDRHLVRAAEGSFSNDLHA